MNKTKGPHGKCLSGAENLNAPLSQNVLNVFFLQSVKPVKREIVGNAAGKKNE